MRTLLAVGFVAFLLANSSPSRAQEESSFVGGLKDEADTKSGEVRPVRNDVKQAGDEVVTLRTFTIKKGAFPEFLRASQEGVWPYFEKLGARVVGMWKVVHPPETADEESPDHDTVILMTRYASLDHWRATRETTKHGGDGPDWDKCLEALQLRRSLTIETRVQFLQGATWESPPQFLPGLDEAYERVD